MADKLKDIGHWLGEAEIAAEKLKNADAKYDCRGEGRRKASPRLTQLPSI